MCDTKYYIEQYNKHYDLSEVDSANDLGVKFYSKLAFLDHMNEKVNKPIVFQVSLKEILYI